VPASIFLIVSLISFCSTRRDYVFLSTILAGEDERFVRDG
jgi:hypothetical protein